MPTNRVDLEALRALLETMQLPVTDQYDSGEDGASTPGWYLVDDNAETFAAVESGYAADRLATAVNALPALLAEVEALRNFVDAGDEEAEAMGGALTIAATYSKGIEDDHDRLRTLGDAMAEKAQDLINGAVKSTDNFFDLIAKGTAEQLDAAVRTWRDTTD